MPNQSISYALDTTTQSKVPLSSVALRSTIHCRRTRMGHLAVLLGLTGNSEEQGPEQEQGQGQEDIAAAAAVELKHVSLGRRYYAVTEVAAAATVTAGGDARKEVTMHGDERVGVVQQQMWAAAEEQSYW